METGNMQWTTANPTVAGWYWATQDGVLNIVEVIEDEDGYLKGWAGGSVFRFNDFDFWMGPLPEPEAPNANQA